MDPSPADRDACFKTFGRAFFKRDLDLMYEVVTEDFTWTLEEAGEIRRLDSREKIAAFFEERQGRFENVRFEDVVYHHAPTATFMTYRMTGVEVASGQHFERVGIERYAFRDGRLTVKDVYSRPSA
ncbi:MAG: nuclear transport factor 2 family protein [Acidobacteriota bacterium]